MGTANRNSGLFRLLFLVPLLLFWVVCPIAQQPPLVYDAENTGKNYPKPVIPDFDQLPTIQYLPNPFLWFDGSGFDTRFASWEHHRNDLMYSVGVNEIGEKPDCSDCTINALYTPTATGTAAGVLTVVVTRNGRSLKLTSEITLPSGPGPFPFVIGISLVPGRGPFTGSLPSSIFTERNIATVVYLHDQITQYSAGQMIPHNGDPFFQLYPELCAGTCPAGLSNAGQYVAWSWGVSRLIDGMKIAAGSAISGGGATVNPLPLDFKHSAITGCSYAGKMALFAGALDERIALTIAQENGGGGAPAWRVSHAIEPAGSVEDIDTTDYSWFGDQMRQFALDNVYKMPHDHHELMAMVAPRALLETGNTDFYWLSNHSNYISARATQKTYQTLGIGDRFGFYIDGGHGHCAVPAAEVPYIAAFVDKFLLGKNVDTNVGVYPSTEDFTGLDYKSLGSPVVKPTSQMAATQGGR